MGERKATMEYIQVIIPPCGGGRMVKKARKIICTDNAYSYSPKYKEESKKGRKVRKNVGDDNARKSSMLPRLLHFTF